MHASGWVDLIRTIPPDYHPGMSLMLLSGLEIIVQTFTRLEEQFLVCRGRPSGSTDAGLLFFIPYDQINCMGYTRTVKEDVVRTWFRDSPTFAFGEPGSAPAKAAPAGAAAEHAAAAPEPPRPGGPPAAPPPAVVPLSSGPALPAKAAMIERLRKRSLGTSSQGTTPKPTPEQK